MGSELLLFEFEPGLLLLMGSSRSTTLLPGDLAGAGDLIFLLEAWVLVFSGLGARIGLSFFRGVGGLEASFSLSEELLLEVELLLEIDLLIFRAPELLVQKNSSNFIGYSQVFSLCLSLTIYRKGN